MFPDKKLNRIVMILTIITLSVAIFGGGLAFCWNNFARPDIDKRIDIKQIPVLKTLQSINDAIEYQNFLMIETMDTTAVRNAENKFTSLNKARKLIKGK